MIVYLASARVTFITVAFFDINGGFGCFKDAGSDNFFREEQPC